MLAPFPGEHENLCSVKQAVVTIFLVPKAVFRKTKEREKEGSQSLLSACHVSSRHDEGNREDRVPRIVTTTIRITANTYVAFSMC